MARTEHRPWTLPAGRWQYYQEWNDALFIHWQVPRQQLTPLLPRELEVDTFEGDAWVSLVAFKMQHIRPRLLPAFAPISNFEEINIRTYVKLGDKAGVYFLSIEGGKRWSCQIARSISKLPYRYSRIRRSRDQLRAQNPKTGEGLALSYTIGSEMTHKTAQDRWLTERYALYQDAPNLLNAYEIHHDEWALRSVEVHDLWVDYPRFRSLLGHQPELTHYSKGVQVLAWDRVAWQRAVV